MLTHIKIQNLALVDDLELDFAKGMSVLTGETGAGKSVIVSALGLALGARAEKEYIRHGATKAVVEATFRTESMPREYREDFADYFPDGQFTVERAVFREGNSKVKINGDVSIVSRLKQLTEPLGEILGQHANQMLMNEENHLRFLDHFASLDDQRVEITALYEDWEQARRDLKRTLSRREELARERELLLFQQQEIEKADIRVGEENELNQERRILDSSRALTESARLIGDILDGDEGSLLDRLRLVHKEMDKMAGVDAGLTPLAEQVTDIDFQLEEVRRSIEQYGDSIPDDPNRLEEINERLDEIYQLKQKYGGSEQSILDTLESIHAKLHDRPDTDALIARLETGEAGCREKYTGAALKLTEVRRKAAKYLKKLVVKELAELAIDNGGFEFAFEYEAQADGVQLDGRPVKPFPHGLDNGCFLFSANPGEPLKSLVKTASGGEISRVLLALKAAEKKSNSLRHSLLVFDEVDAGIGGQTAVEVGKKLRKLSEDCQVVVVTHLHQIARLADHHYKAEKTAEHEGRAVIRVARLNKTQTTRELARMVALPEE
ncbi:MAG: DNA repair protein RecN [candidate division Zixibacteria bacterium]|nr:DNA repair protein RecN [candidate division Zixibacteria bacterium]